MPLFLWYNVILRIREWKVFPVPECKKQFLPEAATDYLALQPPLELGIKCTLTLVWSIRLLITALQLHSEIPAPPMCSNSCRGVGAFSTVFWVPVLIASLWETPLSTGISPCWESPGIWNPTPKLVLALDHEKDLPSADCQPVSKHWSNTSHWKCQTSCWSDSTPPTLEGACLMLDLNPWPL